MHLSDAAPRSSLPTDFIQFGRILAFRRAAPGSLAPDIGKLPWLLLLYFLLALGLSIALNGRANGAMVLDGSVFVLFGAIAALAGVLKAIDRQLDGGRIWLVFSLLLTLLPLAGFIGAQVWLPLSKVSFFANPPFPGFAAWLVGMLPHFFAMLPHLWLAAAGAVFVARARASDNWRRGLYVPLTPLALLSVFSSIDPLAMWQISLPTPAADADAFTVDENVFYGQHRLLEARLDAIEAGKPGVPEIFFLGVAGSEEAVFMRETIAVEQLFKDRYSTAGHSLILVNNPATAHRIPFASVESLSQALRRIGKRMNGKEDLLFLFLTSHGSADQRFSIKLWPFDFTSLTPRLLRKALDDSGIQHRVVVVSACYSGGFVPALADGNTLVMTASAAKRSSFGCDPGNELTDFGRAYFAEALHETRSFTEAFKRAQAVIAAREAASIPPLTPSLPQIAGGEKLRTQLQRFERDLR